VFTFQWLECQSHLFPKEKEILSARYSGTVSTFPSLEIPPLVFPSAAFFIFVTNSHQKIDDLLTHQSNSIITDFDKPATANSGI
jgi:hypothetical protein